MEKPLSPVAKARHMLQYFLRPRGQQTIQFFVLEGIVTSPNSKVIGDGIGGMTDLKVLLNSGFKGGDGITAAQLKKDPRGFEQWCREQGLLIEVNDADYAEPKLAVIS